jgi:hypothetical protein
MFSASQTIENSGGKSVPKSRGAKVTIFEHGLTSPNSIELGNTSNEITMKDFDT